MNELHKWSVISDKSNQAYDLLQTQLFQSYFSTEPSVPVLMSESIIDEIPSKSVADERQTVQMRQQTKAIVTGLNFSKSSTDDSGPLCLVSSQNW